MYRWHGAMNRQLQFLGLPALTGDVELKKHLFDHGYGAIEAVKMVKEQKTWCLDSITFLAKNPAVVGLLVKMEGDKYQSARIGRECNWCTSMGTRQMNAYDSVDACLEAEKSHVIWKMWIPIARALQFGNGDLHLSNTSMAETERLELERTSGYMPLLNNFKDSKQCVMAQMRRWKSDVLMSNKSGVVLARPTRNGFRGEKLLTVECLNQYRKAERMFETFVKRIQITSEMRGPENKVKIYNLAAHALHAACKCLDISIKSNDFSMWGEEELAILLDYSKHLERNAKTITAAEEDMEIKHKRAEKEKMDKMFAYPTSRAPVVAGGEPRDAAQLKRDREERNKRLQQLRKEAEKSASVVIEKDDGGISNLMLL